MSVRVTRRQMMDRLREAGWGFKRKAKRTEVWKRQGEIDRMHLPTLKEFAETEARTFLAQASLTAEEIDAFILAIATDSDAAGGTDA